MLIMLVIENPAATVEGWAEGWARPLSDAGPAGVPLAGSIEEVTG